MSLYEKLNLSFFGYWGILFAIVLSGNAIFAEIKVTQAAFWEMTTGGLASVCAIEGHERLPRLMIIETTRSVLFSTELGQSWPEGSRPFAEFAYGNPFLRFAFITPPKFPVPVIVAVVAVYGGSECTYETTLITEVDGIFSVITPESLVTTSQGGIFLGDVNDAFPESLLVWNPVWEDTEAHADPHRYIFRIFQWDAQCECLREVQTHVTEKAYKTGRNALNASGFPHENLLSTIVGSAHSTLGLENALHNVLIAP